MSLMTRAEHALTTHFEQAAGTGAPPRLVAAMRHAVFSGGARIRPQLCMAVATACGDNAPQLTNAAAVALELMHCASLVHDDMPCMDNDVLRRGKPTVHVKFGEAGALLAGDALQALAFELLTPGDDNVPEAMQARLCRLLAHAAGSAGMAGGQAIDLASVGVKLDETQLRQMHRLKTGALLEGSVMMGAACGETTPQALNGLKRYGQALGLAFQVVDDILDVIADSATLGKTAGKDAANDKPTYVSLLGLEEAKSYAQSLLREALDALHSTGLTHTHTLAALAERVVNRNT